MTTPPTAIDNIIIFLMSPMGMFAIGLVAMVFVIIIVWKKFGGSIDKQFKGVPIESILKDKCSTVLNISKDEGNYANLHKGERMVAKILKVGHLSYMARNPLKQKDWLDIHKDKTKNDYPLSVEKTLFIVKLSFNINIPIIRNILDIFGGIKYAVVERENLRHITIEKMGQAKTYLIINPEASVVSFAKVYVYGYYPLNFIQSLGWVYGRERELDTLVNYPKRVVFLETQHSKKIDTFEELNRIEQEKYRSKLKHLGGN